MSIATVRGVLLWGAIINYALLALWGLLTLLARDWLHRKGRWFGLPAETFDAINYAGIVFYKVSIFLFFLVPNIALRIVAG
jgi:hypothetical protein